MVYSLLDNIAVTPWKESEKPPDRENPCILGVIADADTGMAAGGMDDSVVSHIDRNVALVADDISRPCFGQT